MRNVSNWQVYLPGTEPELLFGRGYTGHEHLNKLGLINMNARLYDPVLGRFISPDPLVGSPFESNVSSWFYWSGKFLNDFSDKSAYFDVATVGFELNQMACLPYLSKMDDFTQFGRLTRSLGGAASATGLLGTGAGVVSLGLELKSVQNGDFSKSRFGYHATSLGVSVGVGMAYGNLPGALAGELFWIGETIYDTFVVNGMNMVWELEMKLRSLHESILYW